MRRRAELAGSLTAEVASLAHADLVDLRVGLVEHEPFADRVWAVGSAARTSGGTCWDRGAMVSRRLSVGRGADDPIASLLLDA